MDKDRTFSRFIAVFFASWLLISLLGMQMVYLFVSKKYGLEYVDDRIFFIANALIIILSGFLIVRLFDLQAGKLVFALVVCLVVNLLNLVFALNIAQTSVLSISPDFQNVFSLKIKGNQATYMQTYYWLFGRAKEHLPYESKQFGKVTWLDNDVASVTYIGLEDKKPHVYLGTYGARTSPNGDYYVQSMMYGDWENDQYLITNSSGNLVVTDKKVGTKEEFPKGNAVQFGTIGLVLIANKSGSSSMRQTTLYNAQEATFAKYELAIPQDFPKTDLKESKDAYVLLALPNLKGSKVEKLKYIGQNTQRNSAGSVLPYLQETIFEQLSKATLASERMLEEYTSSPEATQELQEAVEQAQRLEGTRDEALTKQAFERLYSANTQFGRDMIR